MLALFAHSPPWHTPSCLDVEQMMLLLCEKQNALEFQMPLCLLCIVNCCQLLHTFVIILIFNLYPTGMIHFFFPAIQAYCIYTYTWQHCSAPPIPPPWFVPDLWPSVELLHTSI